MWTKSNIPDYNSERVSVNIDYDTSDRRNLYHQQIILIDNKVVCSKAFYEDDDFGSNSDPIPNSREQWDQWVSRLPD